MGLEKFGIFKFYNKDVKTTNSYTMKKRYEDFVVKEINEGVMCDDGDIINIARCKEGIDYLNWLLNNSSNETKLAYASNRNVKKDSDMIDLNDITIELGDNIKITESNITHSDKPIDFDDYNTKDQIHLLTLKNMPKEQRTVVHQKIKLHPMLYAKTNNDSSISVFFGHKKLRYKFTLKKTNRDSLSACQYIAKSLSIPFNNIKYSGNKDKRAITYQNVSVDCVFIDLYNLAIRLMQEDSTMNIFDIRQCSSHLKLGELEGNRFTIAIRATNDKADFDLNFKNLENGFYNYFGQQRFGMAGNNHIVGKYLLEKNYEGAINTIMQLCDKDSEKIRKIKNKFAGSITDIDLTEKELKGSLEGRILLNRMKGNNDSVVFKQLHNELSKLYFHAYQSYKFNCLVNETENEYIEQEKENSKHLKGNKRIVVEKARDVEYEVFEDKAVVSFTLNPGVFATMALREVIGDDVFYSGEIQ